MNHPPSRRHFLKASLLAAGTVAAGRPGWSRVAQAPELPRNKRERMLAWLEGKLDYVPAAFFMHFGKDYAVGTAAARRHLEYFHHTGMDFVKVQYERGYGRFEFLQKPSDWARLPCQPLAFYEPQLETVRALVREAGREALVIMTLYSPFMWAGHCATLPVLLRHMHEDPDAVKKGLDILTESQLIFVRACRQAGVDGFYMSTQGSETGQLRDPRLFRDYVKPADLVAMREVSAACPFNILHVCDYNGRYASFEAVRDYPGQVVNCSSQLEGREFAWQQIADLFQRPCFGGMDRKGVLARGGQAEIEQAVRAVLRRAPSRFMLGADCTVAGTTPWDNLRTAIAAAHAFRRTPR